MMRFNHRLHLRPGHMRKEFEVAKVKGSVNKTGRPVSSYERTGDIIRGVLSDADAQEKLQWSQIQHPVSHKIIDQAAPKAKQGDELILGRRTFLVQAVDDVGALGMVTIYYVLERFDID